MTGAHANTVNTQSQASRGALYTLQGPSGRAAGFGGSGVISVPPVWWGAAKKACHSHNRGNQNRLASCNPDF